MPDDDIADQIEEDAIGPKKAAGDFGSYEKQSIQDLIAADRYLKGCRGGTFKLSKLKPPSAE
jgi:hypothetical protein